MFKNRYFLALCLCISLSLGTTSVHAESRYAELGVDVSVEDAPYDYETMFAFVRAFLTGPRGKRIQKTFFKKIFEEELKIDLAIQKEYGFPSELKELSVQQLMILLQANPDKWKMLGETLREIPDHIDENDTVAKERSKKAMENIKLLLSNSELREKFRELNVPTKAFALEEKDGKPGYTNLEFFANHKRLGLDGREHEADDLVRELRRLLSSPEVKEISGNTFDIDLMEIVEVLIDAKKNGKKVFWGVDNDVVKHRVEVQAVIAAFKSAGFEIVDQESEENFDFEEKKRLREKRKNKSTIYLVNAVGLNHQKMISINWSDKDTARTILSSGNFTKSGIHPQGDLAGSGFSSPRSIPNANHFATMKSSVLAKLLRHQMKMLFDLDLRGGELPYSGAFEVFGEKTKGAKERPSMIVTFAPAGGLGNIGKHIIGQAIERSEGPIGMFQFAFSSKSVGAALRKRAARDMKTSGSFNYWGVGDTPFMMMDWSQFLDMAGIERLVEGEKKYYQDKKESEWRNILGAKHIDLIRRIHIAPKRYSPFMQETLPNGETVVLSGKAHHKGGAFGGARVITEKEAEVLPHLRAPDGKIYTSTSGGLAILADSFNFSESAESNTEQMVVFKGERQASDFAWSILFGLVVESERNILEEAQRRNSKNVRSKSDEPRETKLYRAIKAEKKLKQKKACKSVLK